jgi:sec-independent protein translocase protein TatA
VLRNISLTEILFVVAVVVIVLSASRMSALGNALGKFVYSFKKASKGEGFVDAKARVIEDAQIIEPEKKHHS